MYKATSLQQVLDSFQIQEVWRVSALSTHLAKDRSLIHRYLKALVEQGKVYKIWSAPRTRYALIGSSVDTLPQDSTVESNKVFAPNYKHTKILDEHFFKLSSIGKKLEWKDGFAIWCENRDMDPASKVDNFVDIVQYIQCQQNDCGLLDVTDSFGENMPWWVLHKLYYADQYKWMEFGRGKLAEITYYGKDSQNMELIQQSIQLIKHQLECLISTSKIDAIAFTPHSRKRDIQLLKELQKNIDTRELPLIKLLKYAPNGIIVAQKSLKTREERIENARRTIILQDHDLSQYKNVLLIDDFVWSGATLNETAKKILAAGTQKVIWFAFVGNANLRYEVIREM